MWAMLLVRTTRSIARKWVPTGSQAGSDERAGRYWDNTCRIASSACPRVFIPRRTSSHAAKLAKDGLVNADVVACAIKRYKLESANGLRAKTPLPPERNRPAPDAMRRMATPL